MSGTATTSIPTPIQRESDFIFVSRVTFLPGEAIINVIVPFYPLYYIHLNLAIAVMKFNKRTYKNPKEMITDLWFPVRNRKKLREITDKGLISPAFRERLMLAVTAVNGCRYCSYFHARQALKSGLSPEEINRLLSGDIDTCPEDEAMAVMYAQHWAESDAHTDPEAVRRLQQTYGVEKVEALHLMLRMIRLGNLLGNTFDFLLYSISFGKWLRQE